MSTFCLLTDTRQYQDLAREIKELHPEMSDSIIKFFITSTLEDMYDKKISFEDNELQKNGLPTLKQVEESIKIDNIAKEKEDELFNEGVNFNRNIKTEFEAIVKLAEDLKRRNPYFSLREFNQKYGTNIGMRRDTGELVYRNPKVKGLTVYNPEDTKLQTRKRIERKKLLTYLSDKFNLNIEELDAAKFNAVAGKTVNAFVANSTVYVRNGGKDSLDNTILIEEFLHPLVRQIYINNKDLSNKLLDQARKEFPELAKQIKVLYTGKSAVSQDEELITQVLSKYLNREIELYGENSRKLIDYISQFIKEIIDLCRDLFSDVNIQKGATITLSGKDIRDVFSFENLAQLINSKEVKFNDTLNGIRRESRSEESNEIDILEEREKLKTLNSIKAIKSVGSKKKFIELLKKANISNGIIDVFSKAYDEIPAIKELSPINALNLISQSRYTDIAKDYQKHILEPINEKLEAHLQSILNKYKIEVNVGDAINKFGDISGVFDVYNKIVYLSKNRNKITMPEEFSHAFVKLMGTKISKAEENKDFTFLFKNVENTSIYKDVYNKYKDIYKNQDGTPNINKIKEEAIGQALSVAIVNKFEDHQDKSFIQKVFEWFENIINSFKNAEYLDFNSLIYKIADEIINNDLSRLNKVDSSKYTLLDYVETLKAQTEKDGGKAMEFLKFFSKEMRNIITGSLSYRFQGTVYRGALDAVHDIDMVVPLSSHGINMNSTIINNAIKAAQNRNPEELAELLWDTEYFRKVREKYPKMVQTSTYPSGDYLVLSTVYSEDESLSKRFKAMNGSYASRLDRFTLEERGKIYLFDFFLLDNDNTKYVEDPNNKINLAGFKQSFEAKFDMGRAKDIFDYQMWETFDEFKDFYVPKVESDGLFYQVKQDEFIFDDGKSVKAPFNVNEEQRNALNTIAKFVDTAPVGSSITLSGYAGTGKTSLMEMIALKAMQSGKPIVFSATTNKAAAVLGEKVKKTSPYIEAFTLNRIFGISVELDDTKSYDLDKLKQTVRDNDIAYGTTVVIDEASMINEDNYNTIQEIAASQGLKIIYVGDEAQLAPVGETKISKVFRDTSKGRQIVRLSKVERTGDNAILKEATRIRDGKGLSRESSFNKDGQGVAFVKSNNTSSIDNIIKTFTDKLKQFPNYFRILAFTNAAIRSYNDRVRRNLGYYDSIPRVGEPMMGYQNYGYQGKRRPYKFVNSESYTVEAVREPIYFEVDLDGDTVYQVYEEEATQPNNNPKIKYIKATPIVLVDSYGNRNEYNYVDVRQSAGVVNPNYYSAIEITKEISRLWSEQATIPRGTPKKLEYMSKINALKSVLFLNDYIYETRNGREYKVADKFIDFGYALTTHKSQGSTFTHVLVDDIDISKAKNNTNTINFNPDGLSFSTDFRNNDAARVENTGEKTNMLQQLEYVAVSRATDTVTVISDDVKKEDSPLNHINDVVDNNIANEANGQNAKLVNDNEFEFYSGGAIGSDKAWASEAKKNGLNIKDYTAEDYDSLSEQWKDKIEKQYIDAATFLGRPKLEKSTVQGKLVRRDMMQADKADAIFAIAQKIVKPGEKDGRYVNKTNHDNVSGGTAYAIARGIQRNIPIYVFDQSENSWKTWNGNSFVKTDKPNITKRAALIGTREINEYGNAAIKSVFNKLVGKNNDIANSNSQIEAAQPDTSSNNTRFAKLSKEQKDVIKSVYGEFITIQGGISVGDNYVVTKNCPNEYFKELFGFMLSDTPVSRDAIKWLITNTNKNDLDKIKILTGNKSDLQTDNIQAASNEIKTETPQILQKPGKDPMPLNTKSLDEYKNMDFKSSTEREDRVMMLFNYISDRIQMSIDDQETPVKNRKKFIINNISKILYDIKQEFQEVVDLGPTQMKDSAMYRAFTQLNNNWKILLEEAAPLLKLTEGIAIETTTLNAEEYKSEIENEDSFVYEEVMASESGDTSVKDGWMIKARSVDPRETLSENTRRILATIIRRLPDGSIDYDDIGLPRTLNPDYAHIKILEVVSKCSGVNGFKDLIPTLRNMVNRNPWMQGVVDLVCDGIDADGNKISPFKLSVIQSQFYSDMYKEFMPYWIQKDGKTKQINRNPGIYYILNSIRDNFESGSQLTKYYKIYNKDSSINIDECDKLVHSLQTVLVEFKNQPTPSDKVEYAKSKVSDIVSFLNAVGIDAEEQDILDIINSEKISNSDIVNNINIILTNISTIANSLKSGEFNPDTSEKDYVSFYGKAFSNIAEVLNILPEGSTMASFREAGKSYYAYSNYGYLGKLIKDIHNWQEQWVEKEFKQYRQFYNKETGEFRLDWLKWLNNSSKSRDLFERKIVLHKDRVEFNDWSPSDYMQVMLTEYFSTMSNKNEGALKSAWYYVPLLADAPSCEFIKFIRYAKEGNRGVDEVIVDKLVETALLEYERIKNIQQRAKIKGLEKIKYYDIDGNKPNGAEFKFFPELNNYYIKEDTINRAGDEIDFVYGKKSDDYISVVEAIDRIINKNDGSSKILLNRILTEIEKNAFNNFLNSDEIQSIAKDKDGKVIWGEETLKDYFYNSVHAYSQIVQLTTSDLAWYKDLNDFQKRFKQVYGQTARLNTHSQFGKEKQTVLFLKDEERKSMIYKEVEDILNNALNSGRITQADKKYILSTYDKINVTDAQGFRSLKSYRSVLDMQGLWTERHEEIYQNLQNKDYKFKKSDFDFLLQTIKPFMYTQIGVESHTGYGKLKMPMQNKNSEAVLLSILVGLNTPEKDNSKLSAIAKFMDEHDIDLVQYDSGIKVGCFGSINLNGLNTEKEILDELNSRVFVGNKINDEVAHVIDFEDYGIQVSTPEHLFDAEALKGSQFQKLILGDLPSDFSITVNGKLYNREGFAKEYQDNLAQNIIAGLYELKQIFKDNKTLSEALIKEMAGSARYTEEQKRAVMLNENGDFEIPLFDPTISVIIQNITNSLIKKKTTKQKIKGGKCTQKSAVGYDEELNVRFFDTNGHIIITRKEFNELYVDNIDFYDDNQRKFYIDVKNKFKSYDDYRNSVIAERVAYWEAYMPIYSKSLIDVLGYDSKGNINIRNLPSELRNIIGYRIPTEQHYSMQPIRIKGFLPMAEGSEIILPADITNTTGSDYDIDGVYLMIPEFDIIENYDKAREELKKDKFNFIKKLNNTIADNKNKLDVSLSEKYIEGIIDEIENGNDFKEETISNKIAAAIKKAYCEARKIEFEDKYSKFNPQASDEEKERGIKARNNKMIDMSFGVLTSKHMANRTIKSGNFNNLSRLGYIMEILSNSDYKSIAENLGIDKSDVSKVMNTLMNLSKDEAQKIATKVVKKKDPTNPLTQIYFHDQNSVGGRQIGIYASVSPVHSMGQYHDTHLIHPISILGKSYSRFDIPGIGISDTLAEFLAASVDNVKDPVLAKLNQNGFTGNITTCLVRLGVPVDFIVTILNQPIVKEITKSQLANPNADPVVTISEAIKKYKPDSESSIERKLTMVDMMKCISFNNKANFNADSKFITEFNGLQYAAGMLFSEIYGISKSLSRLTKNSRYDTSNNAAGPKIADDIKKIIDIETVAEEQSDLRSKLDEAESYRLSGDEANAEKIMQRISKNAILTDLLSFEEIANGKISSNKNDSEFLHVATVAGIVSTKMFLRKFFPHFNNNIISMIRTIVEMSDSDTISTNLIDNFVEDFIYYKLRESNTFSSIKGANTILEQTNYFINKFPDDFVKFVENHPELSSNKFIQIIKKQNRGKYKSIDKLKVQNVGSLSKEQKDKMSKDWTMLLINNDEEVRSMAIKLFVYQSLFSLSYVPDGFVQQAPNILREVTPDYITLLNSLMKNNIEYDYNFVLQFSLNNIFSNQIGHIIEGDDAALFSGKDIVNVNEDFLNVAKFNFDDYQLVKIKNNNKVESAYILMLGEDGNYFYKKLNIIRESKNEPRQYYPGLSIEQMPEIIDRTLKSKQDDDDTSDRSGDEYGDDGSNRKNSTNVNSFNEAIAIPFATGENKYIDNNKELFDDKGDLICG